jgi:hypothetical protein
MVKSRQPNTVNSSLTPGSPQKSQVGVPARRSFRPALRLVLTALPHSILASVTRA